MRSSSLLSLQKGVVKGKEKKRKKELKREDETRQKAVFFFWCLHLTATSLRMYVCMYVCIVCYKSSTGIAVLYDTTK